MLNSSSQSGPQSKTGYEKPLHNETHGKKSTSGWRPPTLSRLALGSIIIITLVLITTLAVLLWQNALYGGIIFAATSDGFSDFQILLFRYLPVVITVLYGMFWGWLDLDIKRLEPYYQLSRDGGTTPQNSLLLRYPSVFFLFVPYKSAKAGHWVVLAVSLITIITAWAVTPLQNGIFITKSIVFSETTKVTQPYQLTGIANQATRMTADFLLDTSSILWAGQKFPAFTTKDFTLAPFDADFITSGVNRTVKAKTVLYETDLVCKPPVAISTNSSGITFDDGEGCLAPGLISATGSTSQNFTTFYIANSNAARLDYSLGGPTCPRPQNAHKILLIWRRNGGSPITFKDPKNATVLFCRPSYYTQEVEAVINLPEYSVQSVNRISARQELTEVQFNSSRFEEIINVGAVPEGETQGELAKTTDLAGFSRLRQDAFVRNMSLESPVDMVTGLAVGTTHLNPTDYLNATVLANAYQSAHRVSFALAMTYLMDRPATPDPYNAVTSASFLVVALVPVITILAQVFLGVVVVFSVYLMIQVPRRPSNLRKDPDCIAENIMLARDPAIRDAVRLAYANGATQPTFEPTAFVALESSDMSAQPMLSITNNTSQRLPSKGMILGTNVGGPSIEPTEYRVWVNVSFIVFIATCLTAVIVLNTRIQQNNGLKLPTTNDILLQILTNIIPTLLATIMEPIWVWLSRMAAILAPVENLRLRRAKAKSSLLLHYAAIPPQLAVWHAVKNGNYLLGILAIIAFTAGVLTVVISGIFVTSNITFFVDTTLPTLYSGQVNATDVLSDIADTNDNTKTFFMLLPNLSNRTSLPPWTSPHQFFMPLGLTSLKDPTNVATISLDLPGYSIDPQCSEISQSNLMNDSYNLRFNDNATSLNLVTSHRLLNGTTVQCQLPDKGHPENFNENVTEGFGSAQLVKGQLGEIGGLQIADKLEAKSGGREENLLNTNSFCQQIFLFGWIRAKASFIPNRNITQPGAMKSFNASSTFMLCKPRLIASIFSINTSSTGAISAVSDAKGPLPKDFISANLTSSLNRVFSIFTATDGYPDFAWRNDSQPDNRPNYLMSKILQSTTFLDPRQPPPRMATQVPVMTDILQRFFVTTAYLDLPRFLPSSTSDLPVVAKVVLSEKRIFMSAVSYHLSVSLLAIQLFVAIVFLLSRPSPFLKRLPTSIAAQISLFANSHLVDDAMNTANGDFPELDRRGWKYGYGKFTGVNQCVDEGIERVPFVNDLGGASTASQRLVQKLFRRRQRSSTTNTFQMMNHHHDIKNPIPSTSSISRPQPPDNTGNTAPSHLAQQQISPPGRGRAYIRVPQATPSPSPSPSPPSSVSTYNRYSDTRGQQ